MALRTTRATTAARCCAFPPKGRYAYDFIVRERAGLYWYHPHPHGATARQTYEGLFGLIEVTDDDETTLRRALDLLPGRTELSLVLQDRRGARYDASDLDRHHGRLGDTPVINGCVDPNVDVATRAYRLRIVNAANARTSRLAVRDGRGRLVPMTLLGTDGGLLAAPVRCDECFLSPAERIDVLVDFRGARPGDTYILETAAFDPMHVEPPADAHTPSHEGTPAHAHDQHASAVQPPDPHASSCRERGDRRACLS